jgi:hypothetical protein
MNMIEQQIIEKISHLEVEKQQRVLEFVEQLIAPVKHYTARELMQMPAAERNAIMRAQLEQSANEDFETFEAYSEEDLDATV